MSQNVQIGISKFHGIWTLALTDTVTLKAYFRSPQIRDSYANTFNLVVILCYNFKSPKSIKTGIFLDNITFWDKKVHT